MTAGRTLGLLALIAVAVALVLARGCGDGVTTPAGEASPTPDETPHAPATPPRASPVPRSRAVAAPVDTAENAAPAVAEIPLDVMNNNADPPGPVFVLHVEIVDQTTGRPTTAEPVWVDMAGRVPRCWRTQTIDVAHRRYVCPREMAADPAIRLDCQIPGYFSVETPLRSLVSPADAARGEASATIRLERAAECVVKYRVLDAESGLPVAGAVARTQRWIRTEGTELAHGDANGLLIVPTGHNHPRIELAAPGYLPVLPAMDESPRDMGGIRLTPSRIAATLSVSVVPGWPGDRRKGAFLGVARTGPAASSAEFAALAPGWDERLVEDRRRYSMLSPFSDRTRIGDFTWQTSSSKWDRDGLVPGDYLVVAREPEIGCAAATMRLAPGESRSLTVTLADGASVRVGGQLPIGARIFLTSAVWQTAARVECTSGVASHVTPGRYDVEMTLSSGTRVHGAPVDVPDRGEVTIAVPSVPRFVAAEGRLLVETGVGSRVPLAGALVSVEDGEATATDASGGFKLRGLTPGEYSIRVRGHVVPDPRRGTFTVRAGTSEDTIALGEIVVEPSGTRHR